MKMYCNKCKMEVEPVMETFNSEFYTNDKKYKYRAFRGYCPECDSLLEEDPHMNLQSKDKAYRKAEGIITVKQINEIYSIYDDVTDEKLANVLGCECEDVTNLRIGQEIPTKEESDILTKILEDQTYFKSLMQ